MERLYRMYLLKLSEKASLNEVQDHEQDKFSFEDKIKDRVLNNNLLLSFQRILLYDQI